MTEILKNHKLECVLIVLLIGYVLISGYTNSCAMCRAVTNAFGLTGKSPAITQETQTNKDPDELAANLALFTGKSVPDRISSTPVSDSPNLLLVNFWASWCGPCKREIEDLKLLHEELANRGLRIIGVSMDSNFEEALEYSRKARVPYTVLPYDAAIYKGLGKIRATPTTAILNERGEVVFLQTGIVGYTEWMKLILPLLPEQQS